MIQNLLFTLALSTVFVGCWLLKPAAALIVTGAIVAGGTIYTKIQA